MKALFYHLQYPSDKPHAVYGRQEGTRPFGKAEWSDKVGGLSTGRLTQPGCDPRVDLAIVLPSPRIGDFVWTWYSDCLVTHAVLSLFAQAGFTGFEAKPVIIERIKGLSRKRKEEVVIPSLWELVIKGKGGDADPESGIYRLYDTRDSGVLQYSSFRNGIIVDEANWDGSDFFTINGYPRFFLVTERVKEFIVAHKLTNCALTPSHKLEWSSGVRAEELLEKKRTIAARGLDSLLADLESPDKSDLLGTIHALGYKGDPRAVDPLIRIFDHVDPFLGNSAASSVAAIARNLETPERIRSEIFSKLSNLLGDENPIMRKQAGTALGYIGGEQAAREVMRLFEDPDSSVRHTGVFVIGFLRYRPALEAVRRLTRDRNKAVREWARRVALNLDSELS